jgi:hypothetical protein
LISPDQVCVYGIHTCVYEGLWGYGMATKSNTFQANLPKKGNRKESKRNNIPILKRPKITWLLFTLGASLDVLKLGYCFFYFLFCFLFLAGLIHRNPRVLRTRTCVFRTHTPDLGKSTRPYGNQVTWRFFGRFKIGILFLLLSFLFPFFGRFA